MTAETDLLPLPCPEPFAWRTDDYETDRSATTYDPEVKRRWIAKGWPVWPLYSYGQVRENIHAATASKDAEVEALRAEVETLKDVAAYNHDTAMRAGALLEAAEARAERLAEALREIAHAEEGDSLIGQIACAALEQENDDAN